MGKDLSSNQKRLAKALVRLEKAKQIEREARADICKYGAVECKIQRWLMLPRTEVLRNHVGL